MPLSICGEIMYACSLAFEAGQCCKYIYKLFLLEEFCVALTLLMEEPYLALGQSRFVCYGTKFKGLYLRRKFSYSKIKNYESNTLKYQETS